MVTLKNMIFFNIKANALLFFILAGFYFPSNILAQESLVFDTPTLKSQILGKGKHYSIYLPPGYSSSERTYPVVYLLHGGGQGPVVNKHKSWIQHGDLQRIVDSAIHKGTLSPMIIVMPNAEMTYYMNNINGDYQFEDFFIKELIPHIEQNYRCRTEKRYRAIAGLSMGGFGALLYSLHHPTLFSASASLSGAVRTDEQINALSHQQFLRRFQIALGKIKEGEERITDFWNSNSILYLIENMTEEQKNQVQFYIDIGDDDYLYKGNSILHIMMRDANIDHEYRVRDGGHNWEYWRSGLEDALSFINSNFR